MPNNFIESISSKNSTIYTCKNDYTPYYIASDTTPMDGAVRINQGGFEYYDAKNGAWFPLPGSDVDLEIDPYYVTVLEWAMKKMDEEQKLDKLAEQFPAFKTAKENYELMKAMVRNEVA